MYSLVDYEKAQTLSKHHRLGNMTLSQLAFPQESDSSFPQEKSKWDNTVVNKKIQKKYDLWQLELDFSVLGYKAEYKPWK